MAAGLLDKVLRRAPTDAAAAASARAMSEDVSMRGIEATSLTMPATVGLPSDAEHAPRSPEKDPHRPEPSDAIAADASRFERPSVASATSERVYTGIHEPLRVCTMVASFAGFRKEQGNASRLVVAFEVLSWAAAQGATMVVFPAGFLRARSERVDDVLGVAQGLVSVAERERIAILVGVDACPPDWEDGRLRDSVVAHGALPYFAVAKSVPALPTVIFRQRSTTSTNWKLAPTATNNSVYQLSANKATIAVILCGEVLNVPVLKALGIARPQLAVVAAHWAGMGPKPSWILDVSDKLGLPILRSVHARAGADKMLTMVWRGRTKLPPVLGGSRFADAGFEILAGIFEV